MKKKDYTVNGISMLAKELIAEPVRIWTLQGSLGAGKTSLVQSMLSQWGVQGPVQSPTYSYVSIYRTPQGPLYHFDLYRLTSADDFMQAGFDEYLYDPSGRVIIEWPEIIQPLLPRPVCQVQIEYATSEVRILTYGILK